MKQLILALGIILFSVSGIAQTMASMSENDPAAKKILDKLKADYDTYKSLAVDFDLTLELPGQEPEIQKGSVIQDGDKFKLDLKDRAIYANGEYVWLHIKKNNEVQINDAEMDEESGMMSPKDMLKLYETEKVIYAISGAEKIDGKKMTQISFKPLDEDSEFSKMTMLVDAKKVKMVQMTVFSKDGSKYILKINDIRPNEKYKAGDFKFDASKYPGIHIEDLRID